MSRIAFSFVILVTSMFLFMTSSVSGQGTATSTADKVKTDVLRYGTGEKAKVVVRKTDGTRVKGFITEVREETFEVANSRTTQTTSFRFTEVRSVKKAGISTGVKIAIIAGVAAAVVVVVVAIAAKEAFEDACFLGCTP